MIDLSIVTICQNNVDIIEEIAMLKVTTSMMTTRLLWLGMRTGCSVNY